MVETVDPLAYQFGFANTGVAGDTQGGQPAIAAIIPPDIIAVGNGSLGLGNVTVKEGDAATFTVRLSSTTQAPATYALTLTDGSASQNADYSRALTFSNGVTFDPVTGKITVPAGVSTFTVTVPTVDDTVTENTKDFQLTIGGVSGTGVITDDRSSTPGENPNVDEDTTASIVVGDAGSVREANGVFLTYDVKLSNAVAADTTTTLTLGGSATNGSDYGQLQYKDASGNWVNVPASGQITLPADGSTVQVRVPVLDDTATESDETVVLSASTSSNPLVSAGDTGTGTITDDRTTVPGGNPNVDEDTTASIVVGDAGSVREANGVFLTYDVKLSNAVAADTTTTLTLSGGATNGADYGQLQYKDASGNWVNVPASGQITLPADGSTVQVRVPVLDDTLTENAETVVLTASTSSNPLVSAGDTGTGTITDDRSSTPGENPNVDEDTTASIVVGDAGSVREANGFFLTYDVKLSNAVAADTTTTLTLSGGATNGADYGQLQYKDASGNWVNVPASGQITLPASGATVQVRVPVLDDTLTENAETVVLTASTSSNPLVSAGDTGTGTITDDRSSTPGENPNVDEDTTASIVVGDAGSVREANGAFLTYDVKLSNAVAADTTTTLTLSGGATNGADYGQLQYKDASGNWVNVPASGQITLPADGSTVQVRVPVLDDTATENAETVVLTASTSSNPLVTAGDTGSGTITDDRSSTPGENPNVDEDTTASIVVGDAGSVREANGVFLTYDVKLSNAVAADTTTTLTLGGSATNGADYGQLQYKDASGNWVNVPASGQITLPADGSTVQVRLPVLDDTATENAETVVLTASTSSNPLVTAGDTGSGTITDDRSSTPGENPNVDEDARANIVVTDAGSVTEAEGAFLQYSVQLSQAVAANVLATLSLSGTATAAIDYTTPLQYFNGTAWVNVPASGQITLPADGTAVLVRAVVKGDKLVENDETVILTATTTSSYVTTQTDTGTGTILNDDHAPLISTPAPTVSVSEEGLAGGMGDNLGTNDQVGNPLSTNAATVSGQIVATDADGDALSYTLSLPSTALTSGGVAVSWTLSADGKTLTGSAGATPVLTVNINNTGNYTVNLLKAIDHPTANTEDALNLNFGVQVSDGSNSASTTVTVNIQDDAPAASNTTSTVSLPAVNSNIMLILDTSGSMAWDGAGNAAGNTNYSGVSRLEILKQAAMQLLDKYDVLGDVMVRIVTFASTAAEQQATWVSIATAKTIIAGLTANGGTDYDAALQAAQGAFPDAGKITGAQNVAYFISDGQPTEDNGTGTNGIKGTEVTNWTNWVDTNNIKVHSYGIGSGAASFKTELDPIAYNGVTSTDMDAIIVTDINQLPPILRDSVIVPQSGTIFSTLGSMGADGGTIQALTIDGTTYTYTPGGTGTVTVTGTNRSTYDTGTHTLSISTVLGGLLKINLDTGAYQYTAAANTSSSSRENIAFTVRDFDQDTASALHTISIVPPGVTDTGGMSTTLINGDSGNDQITLLNASETTYYLQLGAFGSTGARTQTVTTETIHQTIDAKGGNDYVEGGTGNDLIYLGDSGTNPYPGTTAAPTQANVQATNLMQLAENQMLLSDGTLSSTSRQTTSTNTTSSAEWSDLAHGGAGDDTIYGQAGTDLIYGGTGNDTLHGGDGIDGLRGGAGDDLIVGGKGDDVLRGDLGSDTFQWSLADVGTAAAPARDVILDFDRAAKSSGGDVLDLRDLLTGTATSVGAIDGYLNFSRSGSDTVIDVRPTGAAGSITQKIVLAGVDLTSGGTLNDAAIIQDLLSKGKLITD